MAPNTPHTSTSSGGKEAMRSPLVQPPAPEEDQLLSPPLNENFKFFVANLPLHATTKDIRQHFSRFGVVNFCKLIHHKDTGRSCGYGFVFMHDAASNQRVEDYAVQHNYRVTILEKPECYLQRNDQRRVKPVRKRVQEGLRSSAIASAEGQNGYDQQGYNRNTASLMPLPMPAGPSAYTGSDPGAYANANAPAYNYPATAGYSYDNSYYNNINNSQPVGGQMYMYLHSQSPPQMYSHSQLPPQGYHNSQPPPQGYHNSQPPPQGYHNSHPPPQGYHYSQPPPQGYLNSQPPPQGYDTSGSPYQQYTATSQDIYASQGSYGCNSRQGSYGYVDGQGSYAYDGGIPPNAIRNQQQYYYDQGRPQTTPSAYPMPPIGYAEPQQPSSYQYPPHAPGALSGPRSSNQQQYPPFAPPPPLHRHTPSLRQQRPLPPSPRRPAPPPSRQRSIPVPPPPPPPARSIPSPRPLRGRGGYHHHPPRQQRRDRPY
jgi:hypothetical protein